MPVISNLVFQVTASTIVATWTTDVSSDSHLSAGGKLAIDDGFQTSVTSHECIVCGLQPNTVYSCFVTSGGTSSNPQNVTTSVLDTRTQVKTAQFGTSQINTTPNGDTFYTFVSSDNKEYMTRNDASTPGSSANMQIDVLTDEQNIAFNVANNLTAYGTESQTNGSDGPGGVPMSYKVSGVFSMAGSLYMFETRTPFGSPQTQWFCNIIKDNANHGATWNNHQAPSTFNANGSPDGPGVSMFTDGTIGWVSPVKYAVDDGTMGYNTAGNQIDGANGYVYLVFTDGNWDNGSNLYLMRIPRVQLSVQSSSNFQYWNGPSNPAAQDFVNDANWSNSSSSKKSIYGVANQTSAPDIVYIPGFNYYAMMTWYYPSVGTTSNSVWNLLVAPTPAGPWTSIATRTNNPSGFYNPCFSHRTVATNTSSTSLAVNLIHSGDFNNQAPYYHPAATILVMTNGSVPLPPAYVQSNIGGATTGTSLAVAYSANTTLGSCLVAVAVVFVAGGVSAPSITDSIGNSWTVVRTGSFASGTVAVITAVVASNKSSGANTVTFHWTGGTAGDVGMTILEYTGQNPSAPVNVSSVWTDSGGTVSSITCPTITTTVANCTVIGCGGFGMAGNTAGIGFVMRQQSLGSTFCCAEDGPGTAIGNYAPTWVQVGTSGDTYYMDLALAPATFTISGNCGIGGATVAYSGLSSGSVTANSSGDFTISSLAPGSYTLAVSKAGNVFSPLSQNVSISANTIVIFTGYPSSLSSIATLTQTATENFTPDANPLNPSNWETGAANHNLQAISSTCEATINAVDDCVESWIGTTLSNDQYVQAKLARWIVGNGQDIILFVDTDVATVLTGLSLAVTDNAGGGTADIALSDFNASTTLFENLSATVAVGDVFIVGSIGKKAFLLHNGVLLFSGAWSGGTGTVGLECDTEVGLTDCALADVAMGSVTAGTGGGGGGGFGPGAGGTSGGPFTFKFGF